MEDYFAAHLFAEQLMSYIVKKFNGRPYLLNIPTEIENKPEPPYHAEIQFAIGSLFHIKQKDICACFTDIMNEDLLPCEQYYSRFALQALPLYFPDGYSHETFIAYCVMVTGVSLCLLLFEQIDVLDYASGAVSTALAGFTLSNEFQEKGGFDGLRDICRRLNSITAKLKFNEKKKELQRTK